MNNTEDNSNIEDSLVSEKNSEIEKSSEVKLPAEEKPKNKNGLGFLIIAILLLLVVGGAAVYAILSRSSDDIVATVNGEKITKEAFFNAMYDYYGEDVLEDLINKALILQEAKIKGISVSKEDVDGEIENIMSQFENEEEFYSVLEEYGDNIEDLRDRIEIDKLLQALVKNDLEYEESDLKELFENNREMFGQPESISLRHILVETDDEAEAVIEALEAGEDFGDLAAEFSKDDFTRDAGGDMGFFTRNDLANQYDEDFVNIAFSLREGDYSNPVETFRGLHILMVMEFKEGRSADFIEVRDEVEEMFLSEIMGPNITELLERLHDEGDINIII